jgi:hypothetical protein
VPKPKRVFAIDTASDLDGLLAFLADYPMAQAYLLHPGRQREQRSGVTIAPLAETLASLDSLLAKPAAQPLTRWRRIRRAALVERRNGAGGMGSRLGFPSRSATFRITPP